MKNFADNVLMLMANKDKYLDSSSFYRNAYTRAMNNLYSYFEENNISTYYFATDPLATHLGYTEKYPTMATADAGDIFFLKQRGIISGDPSIKLPQDLAAKIRKKYPVERGMQDFQRLEVISKRVKMVEKELMARAKAIVVFGNVYKPRTAPNDTRAIIYVDWRQFIPRLQLSGYDANIIEFLGFESANLALSEWGKYHGE